MTAPSMSRGVGVQHRQVIPGRCSSAAGFFRKAYPAQRLHRSAAAQRHRGTRYLIVNLPHWQVALMSLHHHVLIPCDCLTSGRTLVTAKASSTSKVIKAKEPAPQAENATLALTEEEPAETPGRVDSGILEGGVTVALLDKDKDVEETGISSPEDYWTPIRPPPGKGEYTDQYGTLSPVPQHDGTDCLKTDDTLWTHAEHFKVTTTVFDASVQTFC